ncbi:MAG TPA: hydantoinase/oxoprolinase family protein [Xanthobacteraceae bacterium]|jgi:N-methylhydantoinase A
MISSPFEPTLPSRLVTPRVTGADASAGLSGQPSPQRASEDAIGRASWLVGVDTGGTFTDLVAFDTVSGALRRAKVPSVPGDPSLAVIDALQSLLTEGVRPADVAMLVHGTTVATNAVLEGKGVRAGLLITKGFRAVYEARGWSQPRGADLLDTFYQKPPLLAPQYLTEEVIERLDHEGRVVVPLDEAALRGSVRKLARRGVDAIAICFLFSFVNPTHEKRAAEIVAQEVPNCRISVSSEVLPVIREYPRLSTTVVDAYVGPRVATYLRSLEARLDGCGVTTPQKFLMQSNGGLMRISLGARHPNQTLLSGPAAGVIAGAELARETKRSHLLTFDMGGTSTDISVIVDGAILEMPQGQIAGQDIGTPMLRVRSLGAGGGTVAEIGKDGRLKVGPRSSGSVPGPACYRRGGTEATVTDANLLLGALSSETLLAGTLRLDDAAARASVERTGAALGLDALQTAAGIILIVNTQMAVDMRLALQEQGQDPRSFALVAFGGAGPLHAATLARAVGIPTVLVPLYPGLNCALGMLQTSVRHSYVRSEIGSLERIATGRVNELFGALEAQAMQEAGEEGFSASEVVISHLLDLRYPHQGYSLCVPCPAPFDEAARVAVKRAFDSLHQTVYGQSAPNESADIVTLRLQSEIVVPRLSLPQLPCTDGNTALSIKGRRPLYDISERKFQTVNIWDRAKLRAGDCFEGPAVIEQFDSTTVALAGQTVRVEANGTLIIAERGTG